MFFSQSNVRLAKFRSTFPGKFKISPVIIMGTVNKPQRGNM